MDDIHNHAELEGRVLTEPALSHENHGIPFYRFLLEIPRLSGQTDHIPVLISARQLSAVTVGEPLRLQGQLRSFNNRSGTGRRLILTVYAQVLLPPQGEACNRICLSGVLCKPPVLRRTPLGRSICDLMLAVPRRYGRTDYLPVIAWGQLAGALSALQVSDPVQLTGRIQSRQYSKVTDHGAEERTAYEVSAMELWD